MGPWFECSLKAAVSRVPACTGRLRLPCHNSKCRRVDRGNVDRPAARQTALARGTQESPSSAMRRATPRAPDWWHCWPVPLSGPQGPAVRARRDHLFSRRFPSRSLAPFALSNDRSQQGRTVGRPCSSQRSILSRRGANRLCHGLAPKRRLLVWFRLVAQRRMRFSSNGRPNYARSIRSWRSRGQRTVPPPNWWHRKAVSRLSAMCRPALAR